MLYEHALYFNTVVLHSESLLEASLYANVMKETTRHDQDQCLMSLSSGQCNILLKSQSKLYAQRQKYTYTNLDY